MVRCIHGTTVFQNLLKVIKYCAWLWCAYGAMLGVFPNSYCPRCPGTSAISHLPEGGFETHAVPAQTNTHFARSYGFSFTQRALQHLSERVAMETPSTPKEVSLSRTVADLRISVANLVKDQSLLRESISTKSAPSSPARVERRCGNCNAKAHTCVSCPWPTMCSNCMTWYHLQTDCPRTLLHRGESYPNSFHCFRGGPVPLRSAPVNVENEECPQRFAFANMNECGAPLSYFSQQPLVLCKVRVDLDVVLYSHFTRLESIAI